MGVLRHDRDVQIVWLITLLVWFGYRWSIADRGDVTGPDRRGRTIAGPVSSGQIPVTVGCIDRGFGDIRFVYLGTNTNPEHED